MNIPTYVSSDGRTSNDRVALHPPGVIQGQLLRLSEHHAAAIYLRHGSTWVADFVDGRGALIDVNTWFRFNCGTSSHAARRIALESAIPLSAEFIARIEELHRTPAAQRRRVWARMLEAVLSFLPRGRLAALAASRFRRRRIHRTASA